MRIGRGNQHRAKRRAFPPARWNSFWNDPKTWRTGAPSARAGLTLVELLVVIAIVAALAALLIPTLSRAQAGAQATACRNLLRQIGMGLKMYASDYGLFPPLVERHSQQLCFERIYPYYAVAWTNESWNCPTYVKNNGIISRDLVLTNSVGIAYSYNYCGIATGWPGCPPSIGQLRLGLGFRSDVLKEPNVLAPAEMFAAGDARSIGANYAGWPGASMAGGIKMDAWAFSAGKETSPPHDNGYNLLFADGHVRLEKRVNYLYPPRSAPHWNRDNLPHPEAWAPTGLWAVQN